MLRQIEADLNCTICYELAEDSYSCQKCGQHNFRNPFFTKGYKMTKENLEKLIKLHSEEIKNVARVSKAEPNPFSPNLAVWITQYVVEIDVFSSEEGKNSTTFVEKLMEAQVKYHTESLAHLKNIISLDPSMKSKILSTLDVWKQQLAAGTSVTATLNASTILYNSITAINGLPSVIAIVKSMFS